MRTIALALVLVAAMSASAAFAQPIYNNFGAPELNPTIECGSFDVQTCADDMVVSGGGRLTSFRYRLYNAGGPFFGGSETQSWDISLYRDDGDGVPELGTGDQLLYTNSHVNETILFATQHEESESLFASNIIVSSGSRIWGSISGLGFNMQLSLNDVAPAVGSTDTFVYRSGETNDSYDVSQNGGTGWQMQLNAIVPEPATLTLIGLGAVALLRRRRA